MSYSRNTHISQSRLGPWRVDPDHRQDRRNGPVITRQMTPEEMKKYGCEGKEFNGMKQVKITKEQLIAEVRENGTSKDAVAKIAEKYGMTAKDVYSRISAYKVKELLRKEAAEQIKHAAAEEKVEAIEIHCADKPSKVKFYISTGYDNKDKAAKLAEVIIAAGGEITYAWWEAEYTEDVAELAQRGEAELQGVKDADVVIVMLPGHEGTHTELGAALALGKKILLYSNEITNRPVPFYYCSGVEAISGDSMDLVCEVLKVRSES